jgi:type II secretory pathway pseudopilin PulG
MILTVQCHFYQTILMQTIHKIFQKNTAFTVMEVMAAIVIVGVCFAAFAQMTMLVSIQRQNSRMQQQAIDMLQNIFEQLPLRNIASLEDLQEQCRLFFDDTALQKTAAQAIPDGKIAFELKPFDLASDKPADGFQTIALAVTISWNENPKHPRREYSLIRLLTIPPPKQEPVPTPQETQPEEQLSSESEQSS